MKPLLDSQVPLMRSSTMSIGTVNDFNSVGTLHAASR